MRRVSSQATTSASRSAASTRSVTSSRLPIGVGQTTSRPLTTPPPRPGRRRTARRPGARGPASPRRPSPPRRRTPPPPRAPRRGPGRSARRAITSRAGSSSRSPAALTPPPITITCGQKMFTMLASPTPSARPITSIAPRATGSPARAISVTIGPVSSRPASMRAAERGVRLPRDGQRHLAHERGAGGDRLQAAAVRAVALAGPAVHVDDHVAELRAAAREAAVDLAAQEHAAADPGAEREHHHLVAARAGARARLGEDRAVGVVVDDHRQLQALGHDVREADVVQREVDGLDGQPRARVERARDAEADRLDVAADRPAHALDGVRDHLHQLHLVQAERGAVGTVMDRSVSVHGAGQQLGAAEIDADHASLGHAGHLTARTSPWPTKTTAPTPRTRRAPGSSRAATTTASTRARGDRPEYEVHGRRRRFDPRGWLRRGRGGTGTGAAASRSAASCASSPSPRSPGCWSRAIVFLVSAQIQEAKISDAAERQLSSGGYTLTSPNTVLMLGSDARPKGTKEAGANLIGSPSRSDSILLMRVGGGANATLSIPRDTVVDIPGHGRNKINAAYALGGPSLAIKTVESYLGHRRQPPRRGQLRELPGADRLARRRHLQGRLRRLEDQRRHAQRRLHAAAEGGRARDRRQAGARARAHAQERVRAKREDDLTRARRQQKILGAIKRQGHLARDVRPAPVGQLGRAARRPVRHGRPVAARPRRRAS